MNKEINSHMPNKYCPYCGAIWVPLKTGDVPTCKCSCDPVCKRNLKVKPRITIMARKYMDCPLPPYNE